MAIKKIWTTLVSNYTITKELGDTLWSEIEQQYSGKNRHYHNLTHLDKMFSALSEFNEEIEDEDILKFSIFYHDIIYKVSKKDNEKKSASYASESLIKLGLSSDRIDRCVKQILCTQDHVSDLEMDTNIIIDCDLEVLSRPWDEYLEYAGQIRKEYSIYPEFLYRPGRKKALGLFLERKHIYQTDLFRKTRESQARQNIQQEIRELL